ncbi:hypothetical protein F2Q70_00013587 [Brassica cretica]|uniref:Uncharacterized protein n=1 Tax=Brassica cretica TaxID=69181 RepID=A0A8S9MDD1_BRACR|nr:hypothetical protein F2Q70_00013587 [Brassica cretica]
MEERSIPFRSSLEIYPCYAHMGGTRPEQACFEALRRDVDETLLPKGLPWWSTRCWKGLLSLPVGPAGSRVIG